MTRSAYPNGKLNGIQDNSGAAVPPEPLEIPQNLPYIHLLAERGPLTVELTSGAAMAKLYGAKSFDYREKWANHSTALANIFNGNANKMFIRRIVGAGADTARIQLALEVIASEITVWERNADGSFKLDADGERIDTGATVPGYRARWILRDIATMSDFGKGVKMAGDLTEPSGQNASTIYPIRDFAASFVGGYGDNIGFRFWANSTQSNTPLNEDVVLDEEAFLYNLQFVERPDAKSSPYVQQTINGAQYVEFTFKDGVIDRSVDAELSHDHVVYGAYRNVDRTSGFEPIYGPADQGHIYKDNIAEVLELLKTAAGLGNVDGHMFNFVSFQDTDGVPYDAVELVGPAEGGLLLNEYSTHYLRGGNDGDLSLSAFDTQVGNLFANFENDPLNLMNMAACPMSTIWDSGYTIETKKKLLVPMGLRKDIVTILATQDVMLDQNTVAEESSMAIALRSAARLYPESELYGTPACRAIVVGQSGWLANSNYTGLLPLTLDLADKVSKYMGASDGKFKSKHNIVRDGNNHVKLMKDVNCTYKKEIVRNKDWDNGLIWAEDYDMQSLFYPAFQTVYDDDTSVLNSFPTVMIAANLEKVCKATWRDLTGRDDLSPDSFLAESDALIEEKTDGLYDDRVAITPETYYTELDEIKGNSWSTNIHMAAYNMKTAGNFTIVADRRGNE